MRWQTQNMVAGAHSVTYLKFDERFGKTHPDWFALREDGTRAIKTGYGPHLCWSHPAVIETFIVDARSYFTGKPPESRGLASWYGGGRGDEFMVDASDGYTRCQCARCREILRADPDQDYAEVMFAAVAKVADAVKHLEDKYITTLAYDIKIKPPKTVRLPANVRVRLCIKGPNLHALARAGKDQLALIQAWSERVQGDLVLWLYLDRAFYHGFMRGAVETQPHVIADFLKAARPYIGGAFLENETVTQTYRFFDEYVILKLLWDPDQDVKALIADYFTNFYGPAAGAMRQFYATLEDLWFRACTFHGGDEGVTGIKTYRDEAFPSREELWEEIYTEAALAGLAGLLTDAERAAGDDPDVTCRVRLVRENLFDRLVRYRAGREGPEQKGGRERNVPPPPPRGTIAGPPGIKFSIIHVIQYPIEQPHTPFPIAVGCGILQSRAIEDLDRYETIHLSNRYCIVGKWLRSELSGRRNRTRGETRPPPAVLDDPPRCRGQRHGSKWDQRRRQRNPVSRQGEDKQEDCKMGQNQPVQRPGASHTCRR